MTDYQSERNRLRQTLRARRRTLSVQARIAAAQALAINLQRQRLFLASRRIACYLAVAGEIDTLPIIERAYRQNKSIYLPVLRRGHRAPGLRFAAYTPGDRLVRNRFGILEPDVSARRLVDGAELDLVLTPLVAFDRNAHRLGMGGGYYDRSFHYLCRERQWRHPRLIGVGYDFQRVSHLTVASWDVPLQGVITDIRAYFPA